MKTSISIWCPNGAALEEKVHYYPLGRGQDMTHLGWVKLGDYGLEHPELTESQRISLAAKALKEQEEKMIARHKNEFQEMRRRIEQFQALSYDLGGSK